jgi:hypothetical protein
MTRLLSPSAMRAIQSVGELGMIDTIQIFRLSENIGLDDAGEPYGSSTTYPTTPSSTVNGWLVGQWAHDRDPDVGDLNAVTMYRLRLPVGTDIESADQVVIKGHTYAVIDAGKEQTWPEWLTCTLRRTK